MQKWNSLFRGSAELWRKYKGMQNKVTSTVIIRILRMIQFNIKYFYREFMMFNNHFSNCFNTSLPPLSGPYESAEHLHLLEGSQEHLLCTEKDFLGLLQNIDISKASGQDQISGRMLKATAASTATLVTKLFNKSISTGCFPTMWKQSNIVPIPKTVIRIGPLLFLLYMDGITSITLSPNGHLTLYIYGQHSALPTHF